MELVINQYDAKLDNKKRLTIRGSKFNFYHVNEFEDGTLILKPRVLVDPNEISANTLEMMDKSISNIDKGKVSKPVEFEKYLNILRNPDEI